MSVEAVDKNKTVVISRKENNKWEFKFTDEISIRDVNIIIHRFKRSYMQSRKRKSLRLKAAQRAAAKPLVKEAAHAAA